MTKDLPPYSAVVVVDMKDYSKHEGVDLGPLTAMIPNVLERAFLLAGRGDIWDERRFPSSTGDGYTIGFRPEVLPTLVGPFLDGLQRELEDRDQMLRAAKRDIRMRMRVAITVGPLTEDNGDGDSRVEAHRLVDADAVKALLERSDQDVTFVASILSGRVYEDVVLGGYSPKRKSEYIKAPVSVKSYQSDAYLHVPKPSGELIQSGFSAEQLQKKAEETVSKPKASYHNEFSGTSYAPLIQAGRIDKLNQNPQK